jgi:prepilin-type N-terminal cleavage/methylation domain-containing protein
MAQTRLPGFTLIEVLTVLVIIGVISTLSVGPIRAAQQRSRDAQRKTDLNIIAQALDLYYSENRTLPDDGTNCDFTSKQAAPWIPNLNSRYLPSSNGHVLPVDPSKKTALYFYTYTNYLCLKQKNPAAVTDGQSFKLQAILENKNDTEGEKQADGKRIYEVVR